ncbi:MAG TPA: hypothetical protein VGP41_02760 [Candidatus Lustribacter sp.]|jgi:hypothetical protein|nr:hypothetical protein [Candidatus Lustribacter sp.]
MRIYQPLAAVVLFALTCTAALADADPTVHGPPTVSESKFVNAIQADLGKRFPTAADAERAGYVRYTNEDDTGAISYANQHWQSADIKHPSQLWYDKHGKLLGADFSELKTSDARPRKWGIDPGRWTEFDAHVHYVVVDPATKKHTYDQYVMLDKWKAAGGDPVHPSATTLVAMKRVPAAGDVPTIFLFPTIWDLIVWVKPNPSGAFADKNPNVKP